MRHLGQGLAGVREWQADPPSSGEPAIHLHDREDGENGRWEMGDGRWGENGRWEMGDGRGERVPTEDGINRRVVVGVMKNSCPGAPVKECRFAKLENSLIPVRVSQWIGEIRSRGEPGGRGRVEGGRQSRRKEMGDGRWEMGPNLLSSNSNLLRFCRNDVQARAASRRTPVEITSQSTCTTSSTWTGVSSGNMGRERNSEAHRSATGKEPLPSPRWA